MKRQKLEIGHPLECVVHWYDKVPEPPREVQYDGEVVGWRDSQVIVRVKDYAVIRFWKKNGLEVGNGDPMRRGFRISVQELNNSTKPAPGIQVAIDTDA
jgi:hypothetical protein